MSDGRLTIALSASAASFNGLPNLAPITTGLIFAKAMLNAGSLLIRVDPNNPGSACPVDPLVVYVSPHVCGVACMEIPMAGSLTFCLKTARLPDVSGAKCSPMTKSV